MDTVESPFIEFERTSRRKLGDMNLTPLIDIFFILIIFFMLTTSFMRIESMELILPSAAGKTADQGATVHLFVYANGDMAIGQRHIGQEELSVSLQRMFSDDPDTKVMLLTADGVTMQQLVGIMDRITLAGGKSLLVRKWEKNAKTETPPQSTARLPAWVKPEAAKPAETTRKPDIRDLYGN